MSDQDNDVELQVTDMRRSPGVGESTPDEAEPNRGPGQAPSRVRRLRTAIVAGVVLLAVVAVVLADPALKSSIIVALRPSQAPTATLLPDANLVFLESGAPWGAFSLDGLVTSPLIQPGTRVSSVWIRLTPGRHTLQVTQPPFPSLKCSISLPAARSDTCPLVSPSALQGRYFGNQSGLPPNSRVVDLGARFDRLPPAAAATLVDIVRGMLALTSEPKRILPGDHYLRDDGSVAVAQEPLQIVLQPEPVLADSAAPSDSAQCQSFCDVLTSFDRSGESGGLWSLEVAQRRSWRVTTEGGRVIASHAPLWPSAPPYNTFAPDTQNLQVVFDVRWDGSWHVLGQTDFSFGASQRDMMLQMTGALLDASPGADTSAMNIYEGQGLEAGQGWVMALTLRDPTVTTPLVLYYHFGVLLAANDAAQHTFPMIPVASTNERTHARAIMGLP